MDRIQAVLDSFVERNMAVGTSMLIYRDGQEAFFGSAGKLAQEREEPFRRDAILLMYSMSKVVTAVAAVSLMEKGIFTPQTPVYELIPEFRNLQVAHEDGTLTPVKHPLTIEHLLTMTSGIPYVEPNMAVAPYYNKVIEKYQGRSVSTLEVMRMIGECPVCFEPGEHWLYGFSADVLGGVIVAATGMELGEYMKKTIFDPLGMTDTFFHVPGDKQPRMAGLYNVLEDGSFEAYLDDHENSHGLDTHLCDMGGGGLFSTVDDFARFGEMLRCGGKGVISPESIREMTRNHLSGKPLEEFWKTPRGFGYGWLVRTMMHPEMNQFGGESTGSFGWNGMTGTSLRIDPARGLTIVYGIQRVPAHHDDFIPPLMKAIEAVWAVEK